MHRSRLSLLVIVASVGGCATRHDDSGGKEILSRDPALAAQVDSDQKISTLSLPDACGSITLAAAPTAANKSRAEKLSRQAYNAEMLGNLREARTLLSRASELDGTDKSTAYHLGRTNEALGDGDAATSAYCRYLKLTTVESAESAEARQRVAALSQPRTRVASGTVSNRVSTPQRALAPETPRRPTRGERIRDRRVATNASSEQSRRIKQSAMASGNVSIPSTISSPKTSTHVDSSAAADVVPTTSPISTPEQQPTVPQENRRPSRAQGATIGAIAGAIVGAATGRSVKAAVIGGAAGGILGTTAGRGSRGGP